ncbi:hypothetical protein VK792_11635 [Mesobacterium sp. TK19101]|uniref:Transporter n=1 Tax=Mesobacterium hydrothermale TaxID=3111907 RepID=A0ABU6HJ58_9RHOB|nr:hypothetical protein [Mesobacterium sp. TK19101]MEC3861936.1 hypothetical protein [Mesobacterium sp. TK19101]
MFRLIGMLCLLAGSLQAGAWPRDRGTGFASLAGRLTWPGDLSSARPELGYQTAYAEYGLTDRLTGGLDLGRSVSGDLKLIGFLRYPLRERGNWRSAVELGVGQIDGEPVLRPGLSLGRGTRNAHGYGWLSVDTVAEYGLRSKAIDWKLDATHGFALPRDRKLIVQIQTGLPAGRSAFARLAPSLVFPLGKRFSAEAGLTIGLAGDSGIGMMIGLWSDF